MFADFQNMIKGKISSIKETTQTDITRTPQRYTISGRTIQQLKLVSQGSFGFIWLAEDVNTKQKFALKRIVCVTNQRYLLAKNELELMMKFPKSKNIVACYGGDVVTLRNGNVDNKVLIILMEFCPNGTLFNLLESRQNKGFNEKQLLQIVSSILEGLKGIHQVGVFHLDVKIQNVLIGQDNTYKLCDFGSCSNRFINFNKIRKEQYGSIRQQFEAITTPMYRPPQIVDPYLMYEVGFKTDLWMVGCVLYTLAYFTHPFVDSNAIGIANGVVKFPKYPEQTQYKVSEKINDLIRNFLTPNPAFRIGIQDALNIINSWFTLSQIPLNKQAKLRKQQEKIKQKQMEKLNKKVVDIDGDIPIEQLMEIQKKIKSKQTEVQVKQTSFITSKKIQSIKEGKTSVNKIGQSHSNIWNPPPKQQTMNANAFWNPNTANNTQNTTTNKQFDAFNSFFDTNPKQQEKKPEITNNTPDIYDFFITPCQNPKIQESKPKSSSTTTNLLDL